MATKFVSFPINPKLFCQLHMENCNSRQVMFWYHSVLKWSRKIAVTESIPDRNQGWGAKCEYNKFTTVVLANTLFRSWNYLPFFMKVLLVIYTDEIRALQTSLDSPWEVMPEEQCSLFLIKPYCSTYNWKQAHWEIHLIKLNNLQCRFTNQIGRKAKKGKPKVMHLKSPDRAPYASSSVYMNHTGGLSSGEKFLDHEPSICSNKSAFW